MKLGRVRDSLFAVSLIMVFTLFSSFREGKENWKYTQRPTIISSSSETHIVAYKDTLSDDSLYLVRIKEYIPTYYFRKIATEVCFDNQCRLLDITVFWNITGRYLGFELPDGEFLSKYDHEPFVASEYEKLNELLADPMLPLGDISFEKLIEIPDTVVHLVDGLSGATSQDVSKIVVKGAAYTTYTLWNIVYGPTRDFVAHHTEKQLTPELINLILKSSDISDLVWALNRIDENSELGSRLTSTLLNLISGEDFSLTYNTINSISSVHLELDSLQLGLFSKYEKVNHSVQKMIIDKLMDAPYLHPEIVTNSRNFLNQLNGKQLGDILNLYSNHSVYDLETCLAVAEILQNDNRFISRKAYDFLETSQTSDKEVSMMMREYKLE